MDGLQTQITEEIAAITDFLEQRLGRRSCWNGELELSDDPTINRQSAQTDLRRRTEIHEALHGFSAGLSQASYAELRGWEEGVVEQLQRMLRPSILRSMNMVIPEDLFVNVEKHHYYNRFVSALEAMRQELNELPEAFHLRLLAVSLTADFEQQRDQLWQTLDNLMAARQLMQVKQARRLLRDWMKQHPEDHYSQDAGESLAMLEDALEHIEAEATQPVAA